MADKEKEERPRRRRRGPFRRTRDWVRASPDDTTVGTGTAERARKQLRDRQKRIEEELKKAGA